MEIILYDNDFNAESNWGRNLGKKVAELFECQQIEIEEYLQSKDPSDLYKNHGKETFKKVIHQIINESNSR